MPETGMRSRGTEMAPADVVTRLESGIEAATVKSIDIETLYPPVPDRNDHLSRVLEQLASAVNLLGQARTQEDVMVSDRYIQQFQALLPDLFKWRSVGDGYATVINSLQFALFNRKGIPLTVQQISTLWRSLKELRTRPFLTFEQALTYVDEFEKVGLKVDPPVLGALLPDEDDANA